MDILINSTPLTEREEEIIFFVPIFKQGGDVNSHVSRSVPSSGAAGLLLLKSHYIFSLPIDLV